ncbi:MAG: MarR family transcriptional regulator [Chloroflexi bacterium AL-W]|nr:MarR family transcriptional regulator [Chloroflexi bacterium AL-N1]NOK65706.1 MarR family transcriptional regulator [Chloroflexi bacterium AL-N10]NOK74353.1 MarR family transcriptional regulator [Chloroflexi bacterium AL-N5]NOK80739.1 MarR family transcriptional regulator [Chloroflexi bacterium AL-W]NOK88611.1 MarR family transcriptional regulator [Chloroflexi bacterium AL-N15]
MGIDYKSDDLYEQVERATMQIGWLSQRQFMQLLAEERFDLTMPQYYTLVHLAHSSSEYKMSDLARATHQSAASLTGVIDRLIDKQLVARVRPQGDRRQVMVTTTDRGHTLLAEIKHSRRDEMHRALHGLQMEEVDELLRWLDTLVAGMTVAVQQGKD